MAESLVNPRVKPRQRTGKPGAIAQFFGEVANRTSLAAGRATTFILAALVIIIWAITGPLFGFSDTWQLIINTGTTIITFLMVFLIQNSQNRDSAAIQVKLDELIRVSTAQNSFVGIEHLTDEELEEIRAKCEKRAADQVADNAVRKTGEMATRAAERVVAAD
jgi:low affinity Fe/Cu permease